MISYFNVISEACKFFSNVLDSELSLVDALCGCFESEIKKRFNLYDRTRIIVGDVFGTLSSQYLSYLLSKMDEHPYEIDDFHQVKYDKLQETVDFDAELMGLEPRSYSLMNALTFLEEEGIIETTRKADYKECDFSYRIPLMTFKKLNDYILETE